MLFHSDQFLFLFLPVVLGVWWLLQGYRCERWALAWLLAASCVFYGWSDVRLIGLLATSIVGNYGLGALIQKLQGRARLTVLIVGLTLNFGSLAYFKYADFGISTWNALTGGTVPLMQTVLPLAISFCTFVQAAYLIDAYRGRLPDTDPLRYALFVAFFPHLIAGPIVHHHQLMPQFTRGGTKHLDRHLAVGLTILAIGLFKKTVLADRFAMYSDPVFAAVERGVNVTTSEAWLATIAFTLQIYFDFSAYSDMAIGISRMFGIGLPLNFESPLKATSIGDLWRRWHITLSSFLREYLYFPLGGSRGSTLATCRNLLITMLLCGLWHGAGWNFVIWGGIHGVLLSGEHVWRKLRRASPETEPERSPVLTTIRRARTCLWLSLSFVFFRAATLDGAMRVLAALAGGTWSGRAALPTYESIGLRVSSGAMVMLIGLVIVWCCPNTQQIMGRFSPALAYRFRPGRATRLARLWTRLQWRPHWTFAMTSALVLGIALSAMSKAEEFLYFQF